MPGFCGLDQNYVHWSLWIAKRFRTETKQRLVLRKSVAAVIRARSQMVDRFGKPRSAK